MKLITRLSVILLCLFAAIACYGFGFHAGGVAFFVLGVIFEGLFWIGLFGVDKKSKP